MDDEARAPEWPVYHWDKVEYSDDHGLTARSGTSKKNPKIDDAKPVKPPDAIKKLKEDKQLAMKRIKKKKKKKGGRRTRGKLRARSRAKSRKKRRKSRRKSKGRKRRRKKRTKRRR